MPGRKHRRTRPVNLSESTYLDQRHFARRMETQRRRQKLPGIRPRRRIAYSIAVTPTVRAFASQFPRTELGVRQMIMALERTIKFVREKPYIAEAHYGIQTAHDILTTRRIPVVFTKGEKVKEIAVVSVKEKEVAWGCHAMGIAFAACLKVKRIPFKFVRTISRWERDEGGQSHTLILFELGRRTFIADIFPGHTAIQQVGETLRAQIEFLKSRKKWFEGSSPEAMGIFTINDFDRHIPRKRQ